MADVNGYFKTARTGGGATALDGIDGNTLTDGDVAIVFVSAAMSVYALDADSAGTDDGVNIIAPDANAGDKRWILQQVLGQNYETLWIPASSMIPTTTNGAAPETYEYATNDINMDYLAFGGATEKFVEFNMVMPGAWDLGTIKVKAYWAPGSSACTAGDTVEWEVAAGALSNDDAIDAALGTAQVISDIVLAGKDADLHISGATPAITVGGTPALGDLVHFKVSRNVGGTDDMTEDAWLFGVLIQFRCTTVLAAW